MTIETIIKDCEQSIKQSELFIKAHQANMEIGEIKEYQYYIERDKLTIEIMRKYQMMQADYENRLKADMVAMLKELQYNLYHALCHEIHSKEDCPCTNQTTSCLATFRVCDANRAIGKVIQQKIDALKGEQEAADET